MAGMRLALVGLLVVAAQLTGCIVEFDTQKENAFACTSDADCLGRNSCIKAEGEEEGVCARTSAGNNGADCTDLDEDGWGVGSTCLGPDCDDDDPLVHPGAIELCDGKDNNCDCVLEEADCEGGDCTIVTDLNDCPLEMVDEFTACETDADCDDLAMMDVGASNGMRCAAGTCRYRCPLDDVGACGTAGPDGGGAVVSCQTTRDEVAGLQGMVPLCGAVGAYGDGVGPGAAEACDEIDNDCDGQIDEDPMCERCDENAEPVPCGADRGICKRGLRYCEDGQLTECLDPDTREPVPTPQPETCNGIDDDCNEVVDDAQGQNRAGTICPDACPFGTVLVRGADNIQPFCMDRYEASRPDASALDAGVDNTRAVSRPGVIPWTNVSLTDARDACRGPGGRTYASKRLCTLREIQFSCGGINQARYPYGLMYNGTICNGSGAGVGAPAPTGPTEEEGDTDFAACTAERGDAVLYDLSGNVAEFVLDNNQGKVFGGSYDSGENELTCQSAVDGQTPQPTIGFRCCLTPP